MEGDMIFFNVVLMHWLRCGKAFYLERERKKEFIQHNIICFLNRSTVFLQTVLYYRKLL